MTRVKRMLVSFLLITALAACGGHDNSSESDASKPAVALIMKSLANEFFSDMAQGAKDHHSKHSNEYNLIINGIKNESDLAQQVALIDQMISARVNAIVIAPADSKAILPALARASAAGIVVINIDNKLDETALADYGVSIPFVGPDNRAGARIVGDYLAGQLNPNDKTAILEGIPSAYNSMERRIGFEQAAIAAGLDIVSIQSAAWDQAKAAEITAAMLISHPDLKGIFCANDNMALGAASAAKQAGRMDIKIAGFDNINAIHPAIRSGQVVATADQHADQLAVFGIETALSIIHGSVNESDRVTPVDLVIDDGLVQ